MTIENLQLIYTLLCDDVRLEMGNKISLMGVFQNIMVEKLPVSLIKFAVVNHSEADIGDLAVTVKLTTTAAKPGDEPFAVFDAKVAGN